jgi:hypothetical protein
MGKGFHVAGPETRGDFRDLPFDDQVNTVARDLQDHFWHVQKQVVGNSFGSYLFLHALAQMPPFGGRARLHHSNSLLHPTERRGVVNDCVGTHPLFDLLPGNEQLVYDSAYGRRKETMASKATRARDRFQATRRKDGICGDKTPSRFFGLLISGMRAMVSPSPWRRASASTKRRAE